MTNADILEAIAGVFRTDEGPVEPAAVPDIEETFYVPQANVKEPRGGTPGALTLSDKGYMVVSNPPGTRRSPRICS